MMEEAGEEGRIRFVLLRKERNSESVLTPPPLGP
jgi:hypothetical protein